HIAGKMSRDKHDGPSIAIANVVPAIDGIGGVEEKLGDGTHRGVRPEERQAEGAERFADETAGFAQRAALAAMRASIGHSRPPLEALLVAPLAPRRGNRRSAMRILPSLPK